MIAKYVRAIRDAFNASVRWVYLLYVSVIDAIKDEYYSNKM